MRPRARAAVLAGKLARSATRQVGRGGTALPGLLAERLDPGLLADLAAQLEGAALVTGTNGKTTSARMLAGILEAAARPVIHNRAGSNLTRGLASALIEAAAPTGALPPASVGVFEVDEAILPEAARATAPRVISFGNLLRDQLDRYGEVDAVRDVWVRTLRALPPTTTVVLNADDPSVASLAEAAPGAVIWFGIEGVAGSAPPPDHAAEARWCPHCAIDYEYAALFYAHLGHWRCPRCGRRRPAPDVCASAVEPAADGAETGISFALAVDGGAGRVHLSQSGLYNVYNALAAAATARSLGAPTAAVLEGLNRSLAAFGRQERLLVQGRAVRILLGKNPAGLNEALRTLQRPGTRHHLLVLLNDDVADGTDVSWIWDTDWEALAPFAQSLTVGGRRAADMALRLQYAGLPAPRQPLHNGIGAAFAQALEPLPEGGELVVLPTYTALLEVRERLGRMAGTRGIWEGA